MKCILKIVATGIVFQSSDNRFLNNELQSDDSLAGSYWISNFLKNWVVSGNWLDVETLLITETFNFRDFE